MIPNARSLLHRYLLEEATEEEKLQVEIRLGSDNVYRERLQAAGQELIAAYVLDSLTEDEREWFERYFLSSEERVGKVRLAEVVHEYYDYIEEQVTQDGAGARWFDRLQRWPAEPVSSYSI